MASMNNSSFMMMLWYTQGPGTYIDRGRPGQNSIHEYKYFYWGLQRFEGEKIGV